MCNNYIAAFHRYIYIIIVLLTVHLDTSKRTSLSYLLKKDVMEFMFITLLHH